MFELVFPPPHSLSTPPPLFPHTLEVVILTTSFVPGHDTKISYIISSETIDGDLHELPHKGVCIRNGNNDRREIKLLSPNEKFVQDALSDLPYEWIRRIYEHSSLDPLNDMIDCAAFVTYVSHGIPHTGFLGEPKVQWRSWSSNYSDIMEIPAACVLLFGSPLSLIPEEEESKHMRYMHLAISLGKGLCIHRAGMCGPVQINVISRVLWMYSVDCIDVIESASFTHRCADVDFINDATSWTNDDDYIDNAKHGFYVS
jgi:hypothetical protein